MAKDLEKRARPARGVDREKETFRISATPVVATGNGNAQAEPAGLPRSYGHETLWLMARDPHSIFAYWDIDWRAAFGEENPRPRPVTVRLYDADGNEHASTEVEPTAGYCRIDVSRPNASYHGEIGFPDASGAWRIVSRSEEVLVPPADGSASDPADFATVPMHLSFQRMIDAARDARRREEQSLTVMLAELRQRAAREQSAAGLTTEQGDLVRAVETAASQPPAPQTDVPRPDLWKHYTLERVLGFGNSSLRNGFGGSSLGS